MAFSTPIYCRGPAWSWHDPTDACVDSVCTPANPALLCSGVHSDHACLSQVLHDLGMTPTQALMRIPLPPKYLPVMLDGVVLGYLPSVTIPAVVTRLRNIKAAKLAEEETGPPNASTMRLTVSTALPLT